MCHQLEVDLELLGEISLKSNAPATISSLCTVFAESEVISMIAGQEKRENIIAGIHESAAARVAILATRISIEKPVMMTGGVAKNKGLVTALGNRLGLNLVVENLAQENGAVGAAVLASKL